MWLAEVWKSKETLLTVRLHLGGASGGVRVKTLEHDVIGLLFRSNWVPCRSLMLLFGRMQHIMRHFCRAALSIRWGAC